MFSCKNQDGTMEIKPLDTSFTKEMVSTWKWADGEATNNVNHLLGLGLGYGVFINGKMAASVLSYK